MLSGVGRYDANYSQHTQLTVGLQRSGLPGWAGSRAGKAGPGSRRKPFRGGTQVHYLNRIQFREVNPQVTSERILGVFQAVRKEQWMQR